MKYIILGFALFGLISTAHAADSSIASAHKFGIGLRANNSLYFPDVKVTNSGLTTTDSAKYTASSTPTVFEYQYFYAPHHWGFSLGADYTTITWNKGATNTVTVSNLDIKSNILTIFANAVCRWDSFYISFGLNSSSMNTTGSTTSILSDVKGSVGAQTGIGFIVSSNITLALESKVIGFRDATYTSSTTTAKADFGVAGGLNLVALFNF